jgi:hypothetical protein
MLVVEERVRRRIVVCRVVVDLAERLILYQAYTRAAFEAYFWAGDVIIAIGMVDDGVSVDGRDRGGDVEASRGGRSWEDVLIGFYYVKPNYPGRSSHVSILHFPHAYPLDLSLLPLPSVTRESAQRCGMISNVNTRR